MQISRICGCKGTAFILNTKTLEVIYLMKKICRDKYCVYRICYEAFKAMNYF